VRQPVKLEGTGSNPAVAATPASLLPCGHSCSHGETEIMPAYEVGGGGSSPPGSAQGWLAQWQSTRSTPGERRFDSFASYGGCGVVKASEAVNLRGRGQYPAITPRAGCSLARQAACKVAAPAVRVRISPRPPYLHNTCFHGLAERTPVSETGGRRFESSWKRAWHGTRWCGRQSAKLSLAGSTPARVSSVLTLWMAGDGWKLASRSSLVIFHLYWSGCGFESRPPDYPAVAQSAEHLTIRCAPPHSPAFLLSPAAVTALAVRARVEDRRLPV
jgi:hypothetical protein